MHNVEAPSLPYGCGILWAVAIWPTSEQTKDAEGLLASAAINLGLALLALLLFSVLKKQPGNAPVYRPMADGHRGWWCWLAAARPRAANPVVPVDRRGVPALRGRRAAAPRPRCARRHPPLQVWVRDLVVILILVTCILTN